MTKRRTIKHDDWVKQATDLFGTDPLDWKFVCPSCGYVASVREWKEAGASDGQIAFSCIGRALGAKNELGADEGPCNYAGGGLFLLNPVTVVREDGETVDVFEFAT